MAQTGWCEPVVQWRGPHRQVSYIVMTRKVSWPDEKKFAFTIVDDTDRSTVTNVKPLYDFLTDLGMTTTKTVWVYPSRNQFDGGVLNDPDYLEFVRQLESQGFEIALHNVGSGLFTREEIMAGLERFRELLGHYPKMQINHHSNRDSIYWGTKRYVFPVRQLMELLYGNRRRFHGDDEQDASFWGDACKQHIKYIRNHVFSGINTLAYDPRMPFRDKKKDQYSNYWFSSSDGANLTIFTNLIAAKNVDRLISEGGGCIVYTHFASGFVKDGKIDPEFARRMQYLASRDGWFVPATTMLDYLHQAHGNRDLYPSRFQLFLLDAQWLLERYWRRIVYRQ